MEIIEGWLLHICVDAKSSYTLEYARTRSKIDKMINTSSLFMLYADRLCGPVRPVLQGDGKNPEPRARERPVEANEARVALRKVQCHPQRRGSVLHL